MAFLASNAYDSGHLWRSAAVGAPSTTAAAAWDTGFIEVAAATDQNVRIPADLAPGSQVDGFSISVTTSVLLIGQSNAEENGAWVSGARPPGYSPKPGQRVYVLGGNTFGGRVFVQSRTVGPYGGNFYLLPECECPPEAPTTTVVTDHTIDAINRMWQTRKSAMYFFWMAWTPGL